VHIIKTEKIMTQTTDSNSLSATLLGGLSAPVTTMLTNLVLVPTASLNPDYFPVVAGGFITFVLSVYAFFGKKHDFVEGLWHVASMAFAGFVVVSWARYQSITVSGGLAVGLLIALIVGFFATRPKLKERYGTRGKFIVIAVIALVMIMPTATLAQNVGQPPEIVISPIPKFTMITEPGTTDKVVNVSLVGTYADTWDLSLTSESPTSMMATYLNGRENGPVEIPYLRRDREVYVELKIETHPQIPDGAYEVKLNLRYNDAVGESYEKTNFVNVTVCTGPLPSPPPQKDTYFLFSPTLMVTAIEIIGYYGYVLGVKRKR